MSLNHPAVDDVVADPRRPWKAVVGALITLLGLLWAALEGRHDQLGNMTVGEWLSVIIPTLITFGGIYLTPNPKVYRGEHVR